jgi:hypothetical protein
MESLSNNLQREKEIARARILDNQAGRQSEADQRLSGDVLRSLESGNQGREQVVRDRLNTEGGYSKDALDFMESREDTYPDMDNLWKMQMELANAGYAAFGDGSGYGGAGYGGGGGGGGGQQTAGPAGGTTTNPMQQGFKYAPYRAPGDYSYGGFGTNIPEQRAAQDHNNAITMQQQMQGVLNPQGTVAQFQADQRRGQPTQPAVAAPQQPQRPPLNIPSFQGESPAMPAFNPQPQQWGGQQTGGGGPVPQQQAPWAFQGGYMPPGYGQRDLSGREPVQIGAVPQRRAPRPAAGLTGANPGIFTPGGKNLTHQQYLDLKLPPGVAI